MLTCKNIRVRSFDLDYIDLYWEISPTTEDIFDYDFYVEKSDHEFSGYFHLVGPFQDAYRFRDSTVRGQSSLFRNWYYRIRVVDRASSEEAYYPEQGGVTLRAMPDLYALEMARDTRLRLQEFEGRKVWVFPIRTFGQICSVCVDLITQRKKRADCPVCFDTKWVGGFHQPIETYMRILSPPEATSMADLQEVQNVNGSGSLSNYPEIHPRWIVVELENRRWRIGEGVKKVEKARALVRQDFPLHQIVRGDIEFALPVNLTSPEEEGASPPRKYTNAQDIGTDIGIGYEDVKGMLGIFRA